MFDTTMTGKFNDDVLQNLYKEVFGFDPIPSEIRRFSGEEKQEMWDFLVRAHGAQHDRFHKSEHERAFEEKIKAIVNGAVKFSSK